MHPAPKYVLRLVTAFIALSFLLLAACRQETRPRTESASSAQHPPLILVSIDGFRADYFDLGLTPTLAGIAAEGVRAQALRPSFPSLTFPNHYTLVTGRVPDHHGLVNNTMLDAEIPGERFTLRNTTAVANPAWWNDAQPIWNTARAAGLRSATMFWPGSEAPIHGSHPDHWLPFDPSMTPTARVQQVFDWLDLPPPQHPDFITLYFDEVDHAGHQHGPDSAEVRQALVDTDAALARLVAGLKQRGLWQHANLIVLSDHGMASTPPEQMVLLDNHVPRTLFRWITAGPLVGLEARKGKAEALDAALATTIPHAQCWRKDRLPERFHYGSHRRVPTWLCLADDGWNIGDSRMMGQYKPTLGAHGFDPALESMAALFVAHGPDFRSGLVVPGFDNVDVYPLLARLLRIAPEANDGNPATTLPLLRESSDFRVRDIETTH